MSSVPLRMKDQEVQDTLEWADRMGSSLYVCEWCNQAGQMARPADTGQRHRRRAGPKKKLEGADRDQRTK